MALIGSDNSRVTSDHKGYELEQLISPAQGKKIDKNVFWSFKKK